jgi:hypothetical protein
MSPEFLRRASKALDLSDWDREQLARLRGDSGSLEDLRGEIATTGRKVEQETFQRQLVDLFAALVAADRPARAEAADIRLGRRRRV